MMIEAGVVFPPRVRLVKPAMQRASCATTGIWKSHLIRNVLRGRLTFVRAGRSIVSITCIPKNTCTLIVHQPHETLAELLP